MILEVATAVAALMHYVCPAKNVQITWLPPLDVAVPTWSVTIYAIEQPLSAVTVTTISEFATWLAEQQRAGLLASI